MSLCSIDDPDRVRRVLPRQAQELYLASLAAARGRLGEGHEAAAQRLAWEAVKRAYRQLAPGLWIRRLRGRRRA